MLPLSCALALLAFIRTANVDRSSAMREYAKTDFAMDAFNVVTLAVGI
jgi:hypothetical protein